MTFRRLNIFVAGLALVVGLVLQAPAALLAPLLLKTTNSRLLLTEPAGTIWTGSARMVCRLASSTLPCGRLRWTFDVLSMLHGRVAIHVVSNRTGEFAHLSLSANGWQLKDLNLSLPAAILGSFDEKIAVMGFGGRLRVQIRELSSAGGDLTVNWQHASSRLIPELELGEHQFVMRASPEGRGFSVSTVSGPIQLAGIGSIDHQHLLKLDLDVRVVAENRRLTPLLTLMGQPSGPNLYHLRLPIS